MSTDSRLKAILAIPFRWTRDWGGLLTNAFGVFAGGYAIWLILPGGDSDFKMLFTDAAMPIVSLLMTILAWRVSRHKGLNEQTCRAWKRITVAFFSYLVGNSLWFYYEIVLGTQPVVSWADPAYLAFYPLLLWGLLSFPMERQRSGSALKFVLDVVTITIGVSMMVWDFLLHPIALSEQVSTVDRLVMIAYPVGDAVLLFGLVAVALRGTDIKIRGALTLLMMGILTTAIADLGYSYLTLKHTYQGGDWPDTFYMLSFLLMALSAQYQWWSTANGSVSSVRADRRRPIFSLLPYVSIAAGYAMLLWDESQEEGDGAEGVSGLVLGALVITIIVVGRQIVAVRENTRLLAEKEAQKSEVRFGALVQHSSDVITILDSDTTIRYQSPALLPVFGYEQGQLVGKRLIELVHPDDVPTVSAFFAQASRALNVTDPNEWRVRHENGDWRYVENIGTNLLSEPMINGIVINTRDITERKRSDAERTQLLARMHEQREQLNNTISNVPGIVWEASVQHDLGIIQTHYVSEYAEGLLGYSVEQWLSTPNFWEQIVHGDDKERATAEVSAIVAGRIGGTSQFRWLAKDGHILWVEVHMLVICDEAGTPIGLRGVTMDITKRKEDQLSRARLEQQLRDAQKMESIGTLAGGIAHDFNNILSAIIGYVELAGDDLPAQSAVQNHLAQVLKASNRAKELVDQILTFSRQQEQERKPIDCKVVLDDALDLLRASLPSTIEIRREIDPHLPLMLGDPGRIHQIIMNLATNAMHAMGKRGGILEVKLAPLKVDSDFAQAHDGLREGRYLRLIISDTGCGMDLRTQERIFEPFFTTKAPGEGTGLGLATVYGIVKDHRGAISVYSEPGNGTTFNVYFPVHEDLTLSTATQSDAIPKGHGQRVLFVDDEEPLAVLGKHRLERLGYEVSMHTSSIEALEDFRARPDQFDLLISDYTMPGMNGADLAKHILKARCEMPVILVTGYSSTINSDIASSIGIRELLMKPTTAQIIGEAVHRVLAEQREA
jgi:PAS domain S-box-containing protein